MVSSNPELRRATVLLERASKANNSAVWQVASEKLSADTKNHVEVNIGRLSRVAGESHTIFVPGKVLGTGLVDKKLVVGAFSFSASARAKLVAAGGSALSVEDFVKKYPKGNGVKLVQ